LNVILITCKLMLLLLPRGGLLLLLS